MSCRYICLKFLLPLYFLIPGYATADRYSDQDTKKLKAVNDDGQLSERPKENVLMLKVGLFDTE